MASSLQTSGLVGRRRRTTIKTPSGTASRCAFDRVFGERAVGGFFKEMGRAVWYESKITGQAGSLTAILGPEETREVNPDSGDRQYERVRALTARHTPSVDLPGLIVVPVGTLYSVRMAAGDLVVADGVRYTVRRVLTETADMITAEMVRAETLEGSRPQYRGRI